MAAAMEKAKVEEAKVLEFRLDRERALDYLGVDDMVALQSGQFLAIRTILANFVWDEEANDYMPHEQALPLVGKMSLRQLIETTTKFQEEMELSVVSFQGETRT